MLHLPPGSVLAYSGTGFISRAVETLTCSRYSHVSVVASIGCCDLWAARPVRAWRPTSDLLRRWRDGHYIVESTGLDEHPCRLLGRQFTGVQVHRIGDLSDYAGRIWALVPRAPLDREESHLLTEFLLDRVGTVYDYAGAPLAATRLVKWIAPCAWDRHKYFCSELVADALVHALAGRVLPDMDPGQLSPAGLVRRLVRSGLYFPPVRIE